MKKPTPTPSLADIYETAIRLAYTEFPSVPCPVGVPRAWIANYLMYRAGLEAELIAQLAETDRRTISASVLFIIEMLKYPSLAQALNILIRQMPAIPVIESGDVVPFPGPPALSKLSIHPVSV
jgi:hypothetical protein